MSKRIFTKVFEGVVSASTYGPVAEDAKETWLLQEDIEVIGAQGRILNDEPSENDGFAHAGVELSQVGKVAQDGAILSVVATEGWNSIPAGISETAGHQALVFPLGLAVPVKEEGYLYLNAFSVGKSAGVSKFLYEVIVFYTKKGK